MSNVQQTIKRNAYAAAASIFALAAILPSVMIVRPALAEAQVTNRQITMSSSIPSATSVSYEASFEAATAGSIQGIVVEYCSDSPIIDNETCAAPTGLDVGVTGVTVGGELTSTWMAASPSNNRLNLTKVAGDTLTEGGTVTFSTGGYTNQTAEGTFYARILTFATAANATAYTTGTLTNVIDAGGVALSTAQKIGVTATVQETLTFCIADVSPEENCTGTLDQPNIVLGSGDPVVLGVDAPSDASVFFQLSTNASGGATVRLKGDTLKSGGNTISALETASALPTGEEGFGFNVTDDAVVPVDGATGTVAATAPYNTANWAMILANTTSTYGDAIASTTGPVYNVNKAINFGARANGSTPAGAYTTDMTLVAVGKY